MINSDPKSLAGRPSEKHKLLGQVITPNHIATKMVKRLLRKRPDGKIRISDPCVGPFTFPLSILRCGLIKSDDLLSIFDVDPIMINKSLDLMANLIINENIEVNIGDYLTTIVSEKYDYTILNPPYVRQEWLDNKLYYQSFFKERYGISIPGTSNLYVYFIVKVVIDLKEHGSFACIVYDSWQSTIYGRWLLAFLNYHCKSLKIETVSNQPFGQRLIDATIIYGTKSDFKPINFSANQKSKITFGDGENSPLSRLHGFNPIDIIFESRRGLRLKQTNFFLCSLSDCDNLGATPFLKKVGRLKNPFFVAEDHPEAALLISLENENHLILSELRKMIILANNEPKNNVSILTWFKERPNSWFLHRKPPHAPIVFNYYLRNRPRHIYNPKRGYSDNFYGLIPRHSISPISYFAVLNSTAVCTEILAHCRNQGSGLAKIQLFEYRKVRVPDLRQFSVLDQSKFESLGSDLVDKPHHALRTIRRIDELLWAIFDDSLLHPSNLFKTYNELDLKARKPKEAKDNALVNMGR